MSDNGSFSASIGDAAFSAPCENGSIRESVNTAYNEWLVAAQGGWREAFKLKDSVAKDPDPVGKAEWGTGYDEGFSDGCTAMKRLVRSQFAKLDKSGMMLMGSIISRIDGVEVPTSGDRAPERAEPQGDGERVSAAATGGLVG